MRRGGGVYILVESSRSKVDPGTVDRVLESERGKVAVRTSCKEVPRFSRGRKALNRHDTGVAESGPKMATVVASREAESGILEPAV